MFVDRLLIWLVESLEVAPTWVERTGRIIIVLPELLIAAMGNATLRNTRCPVGRNCPTDWEGPWGNGWAKWPFEFCKGFKTVTVCGCTDTEDDGTTLGVMKWEVCWGGGGGGRGGGGGGGGRGVMLIEVSFSFSLSCLWGSVTDTDLEFEVGEPLTDDDLDSAKRTACDFNWACNWSLFGLLAITPWTISYDRCKFTPPWDLPLLIWSVTEVPCVEFCKGRNWDEKFFFPWS